MLKMLLSFLTMFFRAQSVNASAQASQPSEKPTTPAPPQNPPKNLPSNETKVEPIDWTNPSSKVGKYFTVKDALWLTSWNRMANEQDGLTQEIKDNLVELFKKMDAIRDFFNAPVLVHVTYRPEEYNKLIGGAKNSAHKVGKACDFHIKDLDCDAARDKIILAGMLDRLNLRMENKAKSNWVHLDLYPPSVSGGKRFFLV